MAHDRPRRVAQLIQEELGRVILKGFRDPRISGFLTITGVKLSPDLKEGMVYFSVLGSEEERKETAKGLAAATQYIRREIGRNLKLRYTPNLRFVFDEAIERGDRIERLLKEVREQESARAGELGRDGPEAGDDDETGGDG